MCRRSFEKDECLQLVKSKISREMRNIKIQFKKHVLKTFTWKGLNRGAHPTRRFPIWTWKKKDIIRHVFDFRSAAMGGKGMIESNDVCVTYRLKSTTTCNTKKPVQSRNGRKMTNTWHRHGRKWMIMYVLVFRTNTIDYIKREENSDDIIIIRIIIIIIMIITVIVIVISKRYETDHADGIAWKRWSHMPDPGASGDRCGRPVATTLTTTSSALIQLFLVCSSKCSGPSALSRKATRTTVKFYHEELLSWQM